MMRSIMVLCIMIGPASAQSAVVPGRIGHASDTRGQVESTVQNRKYPLTRGGAVYHEQWVNTQQDSRAGLLFLDESKIVIGPRSAVKLDKQQFDPKRGGIQSMRIRAGTEALFKKKPSSTGYAIRDPNGTLIVR